MSDEREAGFPARRLDGDEGPGRRLVLSGTALLGLVALLIGADVAGDVRAGASAQHVALELLVVALSVGGVIALWVSWLKARSAARSLARDLVRARAEATRWRQEAREHLQGLSVAIDRQFERWTLTPAEREIALLLLKGLSLKEVAAVRGTSERTTRQQTLAIYRKSGLAGRAELSAFFLEDLLAPRLSDGPPQ